MADISRRADHLVRKQVLVMAPASFWRPFGALQRTNPTILYGYSPRVVPPPTDWAASIHVTGYWFLDPPAGWAPAADLADFPQAGPPPVYIGFGSMISSKPEATAHLVVQALGRTGQRGILSSGWGGLKKDALPENVFILSRHRLICRSEWYNLRISLDSSIH